MEKAEEDASVYRTRHRVRVGGRRQYCDQTEQKNVRVPIVLGAPPSADMRVCRATKRDATRVSSSMTEGTKEESFYSHFWPTCNRRGSFDVPSRPSNPSAYDLILLLYFVNSYDSLCCGIIRMSKRHCPPTVLFFFNAVGVSRKLQTPRLNDNCPSL